MDPPPPVFTTILLSLPLLRVEAEVWQERTGGVLEVPGLGGVEARPGVEDERTVRGVGTQVKTGARGSYSGSIWSL